ncbi:MAG: carboxypeptidase-like regulatory domain-containing protein, partial [Bacteroidota bacterium]|nr:carboxypeptidase-like regulatory domain-containing protein [Bacteroidota bacterium]
MASCTTNDSGGFVFDNLLPSQNNTYYYIVVDKPGYKYHREPPVGQIKLPMGVKKFFPVLLEPKLMVKGRLIDEYGRPVAGKIRIGNGALVHTEKKYFVVPQQLQYSAPPSNPIVQQSQSAQRAGTRQLRSKHTPKPVQISYSEEFTSHAVPGLRAMHIVPDNLQDFLSDELLVLLPNTMEDIGDFVVYRRAHRLAIRAVTEKLSSPGASDKKGGKPAYSAVMNQNQFSLTPPTYEVVPGARITVNGMEPDSVDDAGVSYFVWMSPASNASVVVRGPQGGDYVRKELEIPVPDDTPKWMEMDVPLELGGRLTGLVTVGAVPIPDARVMLYDNPGETEPLQTRTDANGQFTLHAVPAGTHLFLAAKSSSPYIGDTVQAYIPRGGSATRNFELKAYHDMDITRLLGFPIEVTALDSTGGKVLLSGQFVDLPANDHFRLADENATLAFLEVVIVPSSETNAEGLPLAQPETLPLESEADELALTAFEHFDASQFDLSRGIHLDDAEGRGRINGRVSIDPASFQFGSGSLNFGATRIGLARDLSAPDRLIISALTSDAAPGHDDPRGYYAGMEDGSTLEFTFYSFEAGVDSSGCFFNRDTLSLSTVLHTDIGTIDNPDLALDIGTIRAHHDGVEDMSGGSALVIPLGGDWAMRGKSWTLDQNGLRLDSGYVDAVLVQIPFTGLQILPTEIEYGSYALDEMTLSNTATINFTGDPYFTYDVGTKHWKVGAAPSPGETTCGYVDALPGMAAGDKILIESFYLKSNGAKNFKPYSGNKLTLYNVATYAINAMYAKDTYIQFGGNLDLGIPGLPVINLVTNYGREDGDIVFTHDPVTETISVNGVNIKFKSSGGDPPQWFDGSGYHANVDVYEEGAFRLASLLHRTPAKTDIIVKEGEEVPIGSVKMTGVEGAMEVVDDAWTLFHFAGDLINNNQGGRLHFTVQGDIVASDQEIAVDQIETPFGDIALVYNFQEQQLEGTLHVEQDLSGTSIVGDATLLISGAGKGWYFF